ncbi:protein KIAA0100-like [Sinocyclocheilus grahami]|uniref:protein KIAA0100-like n=1 Tax=Sinocyclocheilus grahami TaxID=75366 RepID=UPI0007AC86CB|nr:PREDICTED: protein KIAA0100-like [Sinocyclocheilus grahami]
MSALLIAISVFLILAVVFILIFRWFACSLAVRFFHDVLNAELKIRSVGLFSVRGISVQFQPQHTLEIDRIWISCKILNPDLPRFLALCVGEARVRFDLQEPFRPRAPKSNEQNSKIPPLSPSTLHLLSQVINLTVVLENPRFSTS